MIYEPSKSLRARISRRTVPYRARRLKPVMLQRPIVSFSFDDMPRSALTHGLKPLEEQGWKGTAYIAGDLVGTVNHHGEQVNVDDIRAMAAAGHEIAGHTFSHLDGQKTPLNEYMADIDRNQSKLRDWGVTPSSGFAYPYGQTTLRLKRSLQNRFDAVRGIVPGVNRGKADFNQLLSTPAFRGLWIEKAIEHIKSLSAKPGWLILFTHDVRENCTPWGCTPSDINRLIEAVKSVNADVKTVEAAAHFIGQSK